MVGGSIESILVEILFSIGTQMNMNSISLDDSSFSQVNADKIVVKDVFKANLDEEAAFIYQNFTDFDDIQWVAKDEFKLTKDKIH